MFSTTAGLEAALLAVPVGILGLSKPLDDWDFVRRGVAADVRSPEELAAFLLRAREDKTLGAQGARAASFYLANPGRAAEAVAELAGALGRKHRTGKPPMSRREVLLHANPEYLPSHRRILPARLRRPAQTSGQPVSPYWEHHRSLAGLEIIDRAKGVVRIRGESGFYFPGRSYSALEWVNTFDRLAWLAFSGGRRQAAPVDSSALSFSIPRGRKDFTQFGYAFGFRRTAYDYLRAQYHLACVAPYLPVEIREGARRPFRRSKSGPAPGLLALAIKQLLPNSALVLVDLPETLVFSSIFLTMVLPGKTVPFSGRFRTRTGFLAGV